MAAIVPVHNKARTAYFVTWYKDGKRCRTQMVYDLGEARELKQKYDALFPPVRTWKQKPTSYAAPTHTVKESVDMKHCCYRNEKLEGEAHIIEAAGRKWACCERCYRDFVLKGIYKTTNAAREPDAVDVILRGEHVDTSERSQTFTA
jgi:hypothetical protein